MQCISDLEIGKRLFLLRNKKHDREIDISIVLEISPAQYCRLEKGKNRITVDVLQKACAYYNVTAEYILFGTENMKSDILREFDGFSERTIRRLLKILSLLILDIDYIDSDNAIYKLFMGGLMELVPIEAASAIPAVLLFEKNRRNVSENTIIKELGISRFIWTSIMKDKPIKNVEIPLKIQEQYGYNLDFLINNRICSNIYFEEFLPKELSEHHKRIIQVFDKIVAMQKQKIEK